MITFSDPMPAHIIEKYCKKHNKSIRYIQQWGDPLASDTISKIAQPVWLRKIIENSLLIVCLLFLLLPDCMLAGKQK